MKDRVIWWISGAVLGVLGHWHFRPCPSCGTSEPITIHVPDMRKADSLQVVVNAAKVQRTKDSLALVDALTNPTYTVGMWRDSSLEATIKFLQGR